jgi:myo-inositol 2-dehydrogenase/D-chiro-inositol 1-dehydrogenase
MAKLNVGVIGLGRMGKVYARDLAQRVPEARLLAVADLDAGLARAAADELGVAKAYAGHRELLADNDIDAVAVITSSSTHREVVTDAIRARKAVFCEKPMAL